MANPNSSGGDMAAHSLGPILTQSGLVFVNTKTLFTLPFEHLISGTDEDPPFTPRAFHYYSCEHSGYTEWIVRQTPSITLGWDWQVSRGENFASFIRTSPCRSNLMVANSNSHPLGRIKTEEILHMLIDTLPWQKRLATHLTMRNLRLM